MAVNHKSPPVCYVCLKNLVIVFIIFFIRFSILSCVVYCNIDTFLQSMY